MELKHVYPALRGALISIVLILASHSSGRTTTLSIKSEVQHSDSLRTDHQYPKIIDVTGKVWVAGKDGVNREASKGQVFIETASIQTTANGRLVLQLDPQRTLYLDENTHLVLPSISWETSESPYLYLKTGTLRWSSPLDQKAPYVVRLQSPLYEFAAPGGEYVITLRPETPSCELRVLTGQMEFSALNSDESALVKKNQKIKFTGVLESGEIAYDILLHGKKIPRGSLSQPELMRDDEIKFYSFEEQRRKNALELETKRKIQKVLKAKISKGQICQNPPGKLGQCLFLCKHNPKSEKSVCRTPIDGDPQGTGQCLRYRCNAGGQWADESLLDPEKGRFRCKIKEQVGPCL